MSPKSTFISNYRNILLWVSYRFPMSLNVHRGKWNKAALARTCSIAFPIWDQFGLEGRSRKNVDMWPPYLGEHRCHSLQMSVQTSSWYNGLSSSSFSTHLRIIWYSRRIFTMHFTNGLHVAVGGVTPIPDSKVHGANMGPIWGRQGPDGPHVGPMKFVIREARLQLTCGRG